MCMCLCVCVCVLMHTVTGIWNFMGDGEVSSHDINFIITKGLESYYDGFAGRGRIGNVNIFLEAHFW